MKDTGHISMAERPQTFNDVLVDFLDEEGPAGERARESQARRRPTTALRGGLQG